MTRTTNAKNAPQFPIVLKTLHDDIMKASPTSTLTTKKMRVVLRAKAGDIHAKNSSWTFTTQSDYDRVRSLFDPAYAERIAKASKRATKATTKPAKKKVDKPVEPVAETPNVETTDA